MTKEELIQELNESAEAIEEYEGSYGYMFDAIADMVKDSDLVEVVRCKDCKYYISGSWKECYNPRFGDEGGFYTPPSVDEDGYCAWGEKGDGK